MSSAAQAASAAERSTASHRRKSRPSLTRRSGLQLLAGLLVAAGIPVVATVRILDANALRNERSHADATLSAELQSASDELRNMADNAATSVDDLAKQGLVVPPYANASHRGQRRDEQCRRGESGSTQQHRATQR